MNRFAKTVLALSLLAGSMTAAAQNPDVGNAAMFPKKTIVENTLNSPIHKTLVAAVRAAGLVDTLSGRGPFTVFAPTDDAFAKLPAGTVDKLEEPENKAALTKILTYHVVAGKLTSKKLAKMIKKGHGVATLTTLEGGKLTAKRVGSILTLTDEKGGTAVVTTVDVIQKNGVIHVIDAVLMPS